MASKTINVIQANEQDWEFAWLSEGPHKGHMAVF